MVNGMPFGDEILRIFFLAPSLKAMEIEKNFSGCMCAWFLHLDFKQMQEETVG